MEITVKNKELHLAIEFLEKMELSARDSRHRTKLVNLLRNAFVELIDEEKKLLSKFGLLDQEGQIKPENEQNKQDVIAFNKERGVLMEEEIVIEGGMYAKNIDELPRILGSYEGILSGKDAEIYDRLLDEFEKKDAE
ncbi:hypothetical protein IGI96_000897 [Enterococcus sp. DIV0421]|uniref:DUF1617 family protein n=1 Tax=Enterococcus sp. DIV0421 TaxID=2774688 RepID=UPI003F200A2C